MHITNAKEDCAAAISALEHAETFLQGNGMYNPENYLISQEGRKMVISHRRGLQYDLEALKELYEQAYRQALSLYSKESPPVSRLLADALSLGHGMATYTEKAYAVVITEQITILQNHIAKEREANNRQAQLLKELEINIENSPIVTKLKEELEEKNKDINALDRTLKRLVGDSQPKRAQLTQQDAAINITKAFKAAGLSGVTVRTIQNWETGATKKPDWYPGRNVTLTELIIRAQDEANQRRLIIQSRKNIKNARRYNETEDQSGK